MATDASDGCGATMVLILAATGGGCRVFGEGGGESAMELVGRQVSFLVREPGANCLAIVDEQEIWRRDHPGGWSLIARAEIPLQALAWVGGVIFAGGLEEAAMLRVSASGDMERLAGFDATAGREEWFAGGPALGVRSLAATRGAILAGVHVGGIPRSVDGGATWAATIPVMWDVHEVCARALLPDSGALPGFVAAACAVGLALSQDGGLRWDLITGGPEETNSLAVAVLEDEVLFSIQDGPFASRSQIWRWRDGTGRVEQVREGLPEWLDGKVDTGHIAAGCGRAAVVDGGGSLWLSAAGSTGWQRIAGDLGYVFGVLILD